MTFSVGLLQKKCFETIFLRYLRDMKGSEIGLDFFIVLKQHLKPFERGECSFKK